jgi:hypothetical protein
VRGTALLQRSNATLQGGLHAAPGCGCPFWNRPSCCSPEFAGFSVIQAIRCLQFADRALILRYRCETECISGRNAVPEHCCCC